ncbi:response regulator [Allopontixanthobacter sp.]|uniref:response regulator n=1 Tax=Allopontixanthobacter sp. TaxID=2906452 RepID=UPI002AB99798|nr:response regulator [Allopontixanthobacter sp.]MDZ4306580.1 response regulator [Allopontixanthobacter sp.]
MATGRRVPRPEEAPAPAAPAAAAKARYCLLVDDSRMIRKVARRIVSDIGYQVDEAENGEEALKKCKIAMPDLIILDWDMPVMTGLEFLAALREQPTVKRPKVVFCTARGDTFDIHKGIDHGADEYVTKPFDEAGLMAKLTKIGAA